MEQLTLFDPLDYLAHPCTWLEPAATMLTDDDAMEVLHGHA